MLVFCVVKRERQKREIYDKDSYKSPGVQNAALKLLATHLLLLLAYFPKMNVGLSNHHLSVLLFVCVSPTNNVWTAG
jgi:hypothetical protein